MKFQPSNIFSGLSRFRSGVALFIGLVVFQLPLAQAEVLDEAKIFSASTVEQAGRMISEIRSSTSPQKDVIVLTAATLPAGSEDAQRVAEEIFRQRRLNGVLLYLVKSPHRLVITIGRSTQSRFGAGDTVRNVMLQEFKAGRYDEGLLAGIGVLRKELPLAFSLASPRDRFAAGSRQAVLPGGEGQFSRIDGPAPRSASTGFGFGGLLMIGLLIFAISRLFGNRGMGGMGGGLMGRGAGGSFMSGLFGAVAGNWAYNHFFGGNGMGSAWGSQYPSDSPFDSGGSFGNDDGAIGSSSSGSWNDGGDSGGGFDGGGGDW